MTCQVQSFPFTYSNLDREDSIKFSTVAAARRYIDRMGRMDGRDARKARLTDRANGRKANAGGAHILPNFPKPNGGRFT